HRPAAPTHANAGRTRPPDCDAVPRGRSFGAYSGGSAPGLSDRAIAGRVAALSSDEQRQAEHKPDDLAQLLRLGQGGRRVSGEILDVCTPCRGVAASKIPGPDRTGPDRTGPRRTGPVRAAARSGRGRDGRVDLYAGSCTSLAGGGGHPSRPAVAGRL